MDDELSEGERAFIAAFDAACARLNAIEQWRRTDEAQQLRRCGDYFAERRRLFGGPDHD